LSTFLKATDSVLDYTINWNDGYLESGETITTSTWSVVPAVVGGVVIDSDTNNTTTATAFVSGGRHASLYRLVNEVITSELRTDTRSVYLLVWNTR